MMILDSYKSAGPLRFEMTSEEVEETLGKPKLSTNNRRGETVHRYDGIHVTISNDRVVEVEFLPEVEPSISGVNIFSDPDALEVLCALDGNPKQCFGAIILLNLGISLTGIHNSDESQKSVTAFAQHRFDILKPQMTDFTVLSAST